ncbi:hypothetical protein [Lysobacter silvisoli]|uniref:Uncharacterized protein n=1 Tax=Lysobacter silvisoli TaxID=2293254 RepID=A0A371K1J2_9GAMM|nr:hypothetical protein [Lysobacter silvisoli]RDZ27796.1 hypothetical protein DX914_01075 [Lysobacter silvisoli]
MNASIATPAPQRRRLGRSLLAVLAGLLVTVILSTLTDLALHASGVYPPTMQPMATELWLLALSYRALYTLLGGYLAARLAPYRPMAHVWTLAGIGAVLGIAGVVATWGRGPEFGPAWYAIGVAVTGPPCCLLGGWWLRR